MKRSLPLNNNGRQQQPHSPPRGEATIDDLPDELLGLIFRQLPPWLHRVRVEGVSKRFQRVALAHGWADVREFSIERITNDIGILNLNLYNHPTWCGPLLSRVGPHLTTLELGNRFVNHHIAGQRGEALRVVLEKCPRVKHLSVCSELLKQPTALEQIGRAYATTLKSLEIYYGAATAVHGHSEALSKLSALEYLHMYNCNEEAFTREVHLSTKSLANLRHLAFNAYRYCTLSEENIDVAVALPRLRSFALRGFKQFSFLKRFPHLEHLHIGGISDENIEGIIEALPHLGRTLKALGLCKRANITMSILLFERLLATLVEHLPLLEHLEVEAFYRDRNIQENMRPLLQKGLLDPLASSPRLQNVRSLSLLGNLEPLSWAWLEGMSQRLEYLELGVMPPISTLCSLVRSAKNLGGLKLGSILSTPDRKLLVKASYGPANISSSDGGKSVVQPTLVLPTLHIEFPNAYITWHELERWNSTTDSRVRFCQYWSEVRSHVLELYQFGCLSEGRPSFTLR